MDDDLLPRWDEMTPLARKVLSNEYRRAGLMPANWHVSAVLDRVDEFAESKWR